MWKWNQHYFTIHLKIWSNYLFSVKKLRWKYIKIFNLFSSKLHKIWHWNIKQRKFHFYYRVSPLLLSMNTIQYKGDKKKYLEIFSQTSKTKHIYVPVKHCPLGQRENVKTSIFLILHSHRIKWSHINSIWTLEQS